jgi:hypothetical protein
VAWMPLRSEYRRLAWMPQVASTWTSEISSIWTSENWPECHFGLNTGNSPEFHKLRRDERQKLLWSEHRKIGLNATSV